MEFGDFLKTKLSYALVIRGELENIRRFQESIENERFGGIQIIYQKVSADHLWISRESEKREVKKIE